MKPKIGIITIGQTPRVDMIPAIRSFFSPETIIIEKGVLDNKSEEEIDGLAPEQGQTTLVSRLQSGQKAVIAKEKITPIIQSLITELNQTNVDIILLACTGKFQVFKSDIPVIYPDYLLNYVVKGLFQHGSLGIIVPLPEQKQAIIDKWNDVDLSAIPTTCSPYNFREADLITAARQLNELPIHAIILDCMGYTREMKVIVQKYTSKKVLLSRNVIYRTIAELF